MTHYPLDGGNTSIKLREDIVHSGHCAHCARAIGKLPRVVVILDGTGPLCGTCALYSPLGTFAEGLKHALVHLDCPALLVECWRRTALDDYRNNRQAYPRELQPIFDRIMSRAEELSEDNRREFSDMAQLVNEPFSQPPIQDI